MARKALLVKTKRLQTRHENALKDGRHSEKATRVYNRCQCCGRGRGYIRKFKMCRICFRQRAAWGELVGVKKASW